MLPVSGSLKRHGNSASCSLAHPSYVAGATGNQGGAVIKALLANPPPFAYEILAVTRQTNSSSARALASNPKVTLVQGDLNDCNGILHEAGGIDAVWGVFCVTIPSLKSKVEGLETKQGNDMVDAAILNKVKHFVYTSVDRGGVDKSEVDATYVAHFVSKVRRGFSNLERRVAVLIIASIMSRNI